MKTTFYSACDNRCTFINLAEISFMHLFTRDFVELLGCYGQYGINIVFKSGIKQELTYSAQNVDERNEDYARIIKAIHEIQSRKKGK